MHMTEIERPCLAAKGFNTLLYLIVRGGDEMANLGKKPSSLFNYYKKMT